MPITNEQRKAMFSKSNEQRKAMFKKLLSKAQTIVNKKDFGIDGRESILLDRDVADRKLETSFPKSTGVDRIKALRIAEQKKFGE